MMPSHPHHLIVGGQRSGKSRHAEALAQRWLANDPGHEVVVVATAQAWDEEMRLRIAQHQLARAARMQTVEAPLHLGSALRHQAGAGRVLLVDCLTLWLTNWLMPAHGEPDMSGWAHERADFLDALQTVGSTVLLVSNEIGWGVIPMSSQVRAFVDELGALNQAVAARCGQLTLMVAGQPWTREVAAC
ncbi:MAG: bifunctional adenosylcobinamide kinase/adenosylcobinamide-phosphate guanylyltransferase [Aquabacterium sp.]